jgi:nucleoside-triphosphatase
LLPNGGILGRVKLLIEGRPGSGKTTAVLALADHLRRADVPLAGFVTEEMREGRRRVGFALRTFAGDEAVLAHVDLPGPPRVGRYGVDLEAFEREALPAMEPPESGVVIVDELGKMELASAGFREAVLGLFDGRVSLVATVHAHSHPFTDGLKRRGDVEVVGLTRGNRDELPARLGELLLGG